MAAKQERDMGDPDPRVPASGVGVDVHGGPVVDPTQNVISLNEAAVRRQDDLRRASERLIDAKIEHVQQMQILRADYMNRLAEAESKRIDAIRAVDVNAVAVASERQAAAATVLANQVASSADALRTLVSTTAATTAEQLRQQMAQITDRLTAVERSQYEGRGKEAVVDPMMSKLYEKIDSLLESRSSHKGERVGSTATIAWIVAALGALGTVISIGIAIVSFAISRTH